MSKKTFKKSEGTSLVSIIGDEDTVTGFLLTGIGEKNIKGETNFLVVDSKTDPKLIENTFQNFLKHPNIAVILVTQFVAENYLRHIINQYDAILPTILEIPSKEYPYEAKKDTIIQRAHRLLYGTDIQ
uniref:V-type proton ATPase subunit F n=1 Tax=Paramecium tetraurelia TaxID=5888 RepID=Q4UJ87_PARTE|nr:V-ATPase subunit F2 [Paramecium tetraurelia]